jgi:hypothetical protein
MYGFIHTANFLQKGKNKMKKMKILGSIAGGLAVAGVAAGTVVVTTSCSDAYKKINITIDDKTATGSVYILTVKNIAAGVTYN